MKTKLLFLVSSLAFAGFAHAQNVPASSVVVSTDPAKIAEIERRAQQLGATILAPASAPAPVEGHPMMTEEHRAMHEHMQKPGYKEGYERGYIQGSRDHVGMRHGSHGHAMHNGKHPMMDGKGPHGAKHPMKDGKGPHGGKHPMMDGKGPHGAKHPMMDGKGPHGAKPAMPADAPAKP